MHTYELSYQIVYTNLLATLYNACGRHIQISGGGTFCGRDQHNDNCGCLLLINFFLSPAPRRARSLETDLSPPTTPGPPLDYPWSNPGAEVRGCVWRPPTPVIYSFVNVIVQSSLPSPPWFVLPCLFFLYGLFKTKINFKRKRAILKARVRKTF